MGPTSRRGESASGSYSTSRSVDYDIDAVDLDWPFGKIVGLDRDDLRETAYEVFFTSCRSSPGFGGRNALTYYPAAHDIVGESGNGVGMRGSNNNNGAGAGGLGGTSRVKRALGLKTASKILSPRRGTSSPSSPNRNSIWGSNSHGIYFTAPPPGGRFKKPLTLAEIMRQQMKVSEISDNGLRKTLMRTLVGQMGRRAETIILPLELLRHLKPSEFNYPHEYHLWQKRQLKVLEAGLVLHPSILLDKSNSFSMQLRDIIRGSEIKVVDTNKNSETMRMLSNCVVSLSWRSIDGSPSDVCHWADGFPLNIHIYLALLQAIFDIKDETVVLDDVDDLLELMKKTWSTLGIDKLIHNICFAWIFFQQYVVTAQTEQDLLCASLAVLADVANDAKRADQEIMYSKVLSSVLTSMQVWSETRLLDYHESFHKGTVGLMENLLPFALSVAKILDEDISNLERGDGVEDSAGSRVDYFIKSSVRNAFSKMLEIGGNSKIVEAEDEEASEGLLRLAKETEELATKENENFSPLLNRWHPIAAGVAAMTLHNCYGTVLKEYLTGVSTLSNEVIGVLQRAGRLEKVLIQIVAEDSVDCEDGGKAVVKEMVPYEVDSIIFNLLKTWIDERLKKVKNCVDRAKETETWNPKSKTEPYTQSSVEMLKLTEEAVGDFFEIPIGISDDLVQELADGLESLFQDYISFVSLCGSKQSYIPTLPPLTRCNKDSKFLKLWRKASHCRVGTEESHKGGSADGHHPRPSTSRGTQRLYIRLNTLHHILSELHSLDKSLSQCPCQNPSPHNRYSSSRKHLSTSPSYFDLARSSIQEASQHVSEVAAFRLIFLDSNTAFYDSLYVGDVTNARIRPALRNLKQNLTFLAAIVTDRAQPLAVKEVMKASFEAFLMILLAGGSTRIFLKLDHEMISDDFESLKRVFCSYGEGLVAEEVMDKEAEIVEGVVELMGQPTDQLVEDFSIAACEASGMGMIGTGQKLPMPPTTGRWNRADANTILRVLCYRNDIVANRFLKTTFQLAKRR